VLSYRRTDGVERLKVLLNMGAEPQFTECPPGVVLLSTEGGRAGKEISGNVKLGAGEGVVVLLR
jgi:hypothetical protein